MHLASLPPGHHRLAQALHYRCMPGVVDMQVGLQHKHGAVGRALTALSRKRMGWSSSKRYAE